MKVILAALDFSDATPRVVEEAAKLAQAVDGQVVLLHVARVPGAMPHHPTEMAQLAGAIQEIEAAADRQLLETERGLRERGVVTQSLRLTGEPKKDIVEQGERLATDYIVMGSHGHSALHDLVMGSTTNAVIKRSNRAVLVVPAPKTARTAE